MSVIYDEKESKENTINNDEIDLVELFSVLWKGKITVILITLFFAVGSVIFALSLKNHYKSEAVLAMANASNDSSVLSNLSGIASMAGINIPNADQDKTNLVIETIRSRAFLRYLISNHDILPSMMATKSYDTESQEIIFDPKVYDANAGKWVRKPSKNQQVKPSYLEAYETYSNQLSITKNKATGFLDVTVEHLSPIFAQQFLQLIIKEANEQLRNQDLRESSDAINFLTSEFPKSNLVSMKEAISVLVQSRIERQMMAKINTDYVLKILEPPFIPEKKSKPKRAIICIVITMIGGIIALMWVLFRHYYLQSNVRFAFRGR